MNRAPLAHDEWYHCYTRGVDKRQTFEKDEDYERFIQILYLANSDMALHRSDYGNDKKRIFSVDRGEPLVAIGAYCLMPNHFHLLLKGTGENENAISKFMQKVGTAYTMYFNKKNERTGNLFVKPFRSRHVDRDDYFRYVAQYIHFNPIELFEKGWKEGRVVNSSALEQRIRMYSHSSLPEYEREEPERLQTVVLDKEARNLLLDGRPSLQQALGDMREYYATLSM